MGARDAELPGGLFGQCLFWWIQMKVVLPIQELFGTLGWHEHTENQEHCPTIAFSTLGGEEC